MATATPEHTTTLKVLFLGTGTSQGIPVIGCTCPVCQSSDPRDTRRRCSILLSLNGFSLLVDTSPDLRDQLLTYQITRIDAVLFTHAHRDHTGGLDDLRPIFFLHRQPIPIYATPETWQSLEQQFYFIFRARHYPGVLQIREHIISWDTPFSIGPFTIQPILLWHHKMPVLGFRIGPFAYLTDLKRIDPAYLHHLQGLDVLVLGVLQREPHLAHLNLSEALQLIEQLQPRQTYFTHISHYLGKHADLIAELPPGIAPAYDGLEIQIALTAHAPPPT